MRKHSSAMCMGLGLLAAVVAAPALADAQDGSVPITRVKRIGTRLETIVVSGGAVDPQNQRWKDSGSKTAVLPTVSETAFLDGNETEHVEAQQP